jgi:hypothetical protein
MRMASCTTSSQKFKMRARKNREEDEDFFEECFFDKLTIFYETI